MYVARNSMSEISGYTESALSKQNCYVMIMLVNLEASTDSDSDILQTPFSKETMSPANAIDIC